MPTKQATQQLLQKTSHRLLPNIQKKIIEMFEDFLKKIYNHQMWSDLLKKSF